MNLPGTRVLVVGMGLSGQAAARLALSRGATVTCTDLRDDAPSVPGCAAVYGSHRLEDFLQADLIVASPGVPPSIEPLRKAAAHGVEIVGELGFAARGLKVPVVAITGTNGKSSTTWFTAQLLEQAGFRPFVGG
ncbi:MAG: UDP-N-acetylmuramoyl-L-alanine--D-glutamate ligase, partial [Myxococcota bacterium]|nr:UDP-N-acetylmuramoyl-L-alanine--D-glutamate ligase [Myxococcota bacterium]